MSWVSSVYECAVKVERRSLSES